ncbi:PDK [Symbiodinium sp. CCMP2592]|nr:PDK [Symbiodinium sp. CCMP2592]
MKTPDGLTSTLQEELPIRLANRIAHLDMLPDLKEAPEICSVRDDFAQAFTEVRAARPDEFPSVIRRFKKRNEHHALRLTLGMKQWGDLQRRKGQPYDDTRAFIDNFLNRLFLSRIGMETLTSQFLALSRAPDGIVDLNCDPCQVCASAAKQVTGVASEYLRTVPRIEISFHGNERARTLPLIPQYLLYIVAELLKNSLRAVGEQFEANPNGRTEPEPVQIRVASDESQVALLVMDRGGGIPFQRQPHVWSYMYSTARGNQVCEATGRVLQEGSAPTSFSGYGVGLPLSRLYAEYLGGSLHLMSMPNFGTHAYVFLQQSSDRAEALPTYVNWLRKRRLREDILKYVACLNLLLGMSPVVL